MEVIQAVITTQGKVTFTSREVGRLADTESYLLNTALYYAFGLASGRYIDTDQTPTYVEDTDEIADEMYVSPAAPIVGEGEGGIDTITTIRNARPDTYTTPVYGQDGPLANINVPMFERERSLINGNRFRSLIIPRDRSINAHSIADRLPSYIRLGSGRGKATVIYEVVQANQASGEYDLGHPISIYDLAQRPRGNVVTKQMRPTPLVLQGTYKGDYLRVPKSLHEERNDETVERFAYPATPRFLETKR